MPNKFKKYLWGLSLMSLFQLWALGGLGSIGMDAMAVAYVLPNTWIPLQPEIQRPSTIHISQTAQGNDTGMCR